MKTIRLKWLVGVALAAACGMMAGCGEMGNGNMQAVRGTPVTVVVDANAAGKAIPANFAGLSMEMQYVNPRADGKYLFSAENAALVRLFKQLGVKCLRVGGNTADNPQIPVPGPRDIDSLFGFAKAAGMKVIYTLRLKNTPDPAKDVEIAKYVMDHYPSELIGFQIGNEPNVYAKTYPEYKALFEKFVKAIRAVSPEAMFCGPNTTPGKAEWAREFTNDFGQMGVLSLVTQHAYFGGNGRKATDVAAARDAMLSPKWLAEYQKMYDAFVPTAEKNHLPYRIEETNSFYNGGAKDVSNTYASSLWALDYLHWWASHDASGLNFHTGDHVAAADESAPCWYAAFWSSPEGYHVHPVGYALKAFELGSHGASTPVKVNGAEGMNITAYAVKGDDGHLYVTLINKEHGAEGKNAMVSIQVAGYGRGEMMALKEPHGDIAAREGETLGGSSIQDDASWNGKWKSVDTSRVALPEATAVVVRME